MDIKDVTSLPLSKSPGSERAAAAVQQHPLVTKPVEDVVEISAQPVVATHHAVNDAINTLNIASDATADIERYFKSIEGFTEQVDLHNLSSVRNEKLAEEANQVVAAIRARATVTSASGVQPLSGEKIRIELEQELKALEIALPADASEAFGIGPISFSQKEAIFQTRASVVIARERLESLQKSIEDSKQLLSAVVNRLEVASENSAASKTSIRDLDAAVELAQNAHLGIERDPGQALGSIGVPRQGTVDLLKS